METAEHREAFIPFRRTDVIELCVQDGRLDANTTEAFQSFCTILSAFYHFKFHRYLETIKDNYSCFNPDAEVRPLYDPSLQDYEQMGQAVVQAFQSVLERANYRKLPQSIIQKSLDNRSLIDLQTEVDFDDFDQFLCYYRGDIDKTFSVKRFFFWEKEQTVDILERLVLSIKFKGKGYFQKKIRQKQRSEGALKFTPGKMYVYFYKNIPKLDLDLLFPNIQTSMTWRDLVLFAVPAIGAAVPVLLKTLPNLLILIAAILIALNAYSSLESLNVEEEQARNVMPVLIATLTLVIALGGFAVKQYSKYKSKKIKFQKDVSDTLFFKNLATNASVFQQLVDLAEEEECKEIILVYYHLLTSPEPLTPVELDAQIETWMKEKTGAQINFDIQGPLQNLHAIRGQVQGKEQALLSYDDRGRCAVPPLTTASTILDNIWDTLFRYSEDKSNDLTV